MMELKKGLLEGIYHIKCQECKKEIPIRKEELRLNNIFCLNCGTIENPLVNKRDLKVMELKK